MAIALVHGEAGLALPSESSDLVGPTALFALNTICINEPSMFVHENKLPSI